MAVSKLGIGKKTLIKELEKNKRVIKSRRRGKF
jgi:hypothetical protein